MTDLITRLGAATGPDRGLDAEIAEACGWRHSAWRTWVIPPGDRVLFVLPAFTESVDAALTLVPEGLGVFTGERLAGKLGSHVQLIGPSAPFMSNSIVHGEAFLPADRSYENARKLLPRAICIAALHALRARSVSASPSDPNPS